MKISCVYKITSKINGKFYIGSSIHFDRRIKDHFRSLKSNSHTNTKLQNHCNKYGIDDFEVSIIEIIEFRVDLIPREQFYLDTLTPFFNIYKSANSPAGTPRSEEVKLKMSMARKGKPSPKKGIPSNIPVSEENKEKLRKLMIGNKFSLGVKATPESIDKRLKSREGYVHSEETKIKIGVANKVTATEHWKIKKGFTHSKETRIKMSESAKNRQYTPEGIKSRTESRRNYIITDETRKKMSESAKISATKRDKNKSGRFI